VGGESPTVFLKLTCSILVATALDICGEEAEGKSQYSYSQFINASSAGASLIGIKKNFYT